MLNEDKIKLMINISILEKREDRRVFPMSRCFRGNCVSSHMARSFVGYTFCWTLGTIMWVLYKAELLFNTEVLNDMWRTFMLHGMLYSDGLILYLMVTYIVYSRCYKRSSLGMKAYLTGLRRLSERHEYQNKAKDMTREDDRTWLNYLY